MLHQIAIKALTVCIFSLLYGCASIHTVCSDGIDKTTFAAGIINIPGPADGSSYTVTATGFGIIKAANDLTFGYSKTKQTAINSNCQLVFIIENGTDAKEAVELVKGIENSCVINASQTNSDVEPK